MTIALMVMAGIAQLFGIFGRGLSGSQATVDLSAKARAASWQLRKDLAGLTCDVVPWVAPEANAGYFEYIEGARKDLDAANGTPDIEADTDDVLLFTTRSIGDPFVGTVIVSGTPRGTAEAEYAEVAWFCRPAPDQPVPGLRMNNLFRRQLLVSAAPGAGAFSSAARISGTNIDAEPWSIRKVTGTSGAFSYANSLGDLTKRPHRFMHHWPNAVFANGDHRMLTGTSTQLPSALEGLTFEPVVSKNDDGDSDGADEDGEAGPRTGEDVVLTNVIAFDVRAFEPKVADYLDLGGGGSGTLALPPNPAAGLTTPTYDTWDTQSPKPPPYPVPLRGIEVRIRCYEPTSKQIRQITVRHTFVKK